jgi:hypothetical protein
VAFDAIGWESGLVVIGISCSLKIGLMAIYAFVSNWVKSQSGIRIVAIRAVGQCMVSQKWKSIAVVDGIDIIHQPIIGCMASGAIHSHRLLVHVQVTRITLVGCF